MDKINRILLPVIILIVWLMPVSNQWNLLNNEMIRTCYLMNLLVLLIVFLYEGRFSKRQLFIAVSIILILIVTTIVFFNFNKENVKISYGYLLNYIPFCILINIRTEKLSKSKVLDYLFIAICTLLIIVGILTIAGNVFMEQLLKTYYIMHYPHVYTVMWASHKTVTFFATHSIACYIYFMLWWLLEYRGQIKRGAFNYILMGGMILNILMCMSVSGVLCIGLIVGYYYLKWMKKATKKGIIRSFSIAIVGFVAVLGNFDSIMEILGSRHNGILGRYGSTGNLMDTLSYALTNIIPMGICDVEGLWLTDGGYYIHFIRGGIILVILFYFGLYRFLKANIRDKGRCMFLYICLLLFEIGYQFTMSMRFFMIMLFLIIYYNHLSKLEECSKNITASTL